MYDIKQSTAITVPFFVHDVNGDAVTGLTDGSFTKRISKNGAAFAAMTVTITEMENGWYSIPLSTAHTDTLGLLTVVFTNGGSKQVNLQWRVEARLKDDLAYPTVSGRSVDVTTTGEVGIDLDNVNGTLGAAEIAADAIGASQLATDAVNEIVDQVWNELQADHVAAGSFGEIATEIATLLTRIPDTVSLANINAEVDTALADIHLDHLLAVDYDPAAKPGVATALLNEIIENDAGVSRFTTNALEQVWQVATRILTASTNFNDLSAAQVNAEVDTALSDIGLHLLLNTALPTSWAADITANSALDYLADDGTAVYDRTTDSLQAQADAGGGGGDWTTAEKEQIRFRLGMDGTQTDPTTNTGTIEDILADTNELQTDDVPGLIAALNNLSAAQVNAEVDTALADIHLDHLLAVDYDPAAKPGVATALLNELIESDAGVSRFTSNALEQVWQVATRILTANTNFNDPTAAAIADQVWNELQADHVAVGSFGEMATEIASILADTNELQTDDVPGLIAALNNLSAAQVNAEVVDVLTVDTFAQPGQGTPPATTSMLLMLSYLYKQWRNRSNQTSTTWQLFNDDGTTVDQKATVSDDTVTSEKGEIATGP